MALEQSPTTDARRNDTFPTRIVLEHAGLLGRWGNTIAWTIAGISLLTALGSIGSMTAYFEPDGNVSEKYHSLSKEAPLKVAILTVSGTIMGGNGFARHQIDRIEKDESVRAIVLRVDSPGGTVSGSDELHYRLLTMAMKRKLPVVVSMGSIAASGGYYISMANGGQDDVIFAEPSTLTGSIGVIIPHYDFSKLMKRLEIDDDSVSSGPLKEMLSPTKQRAPELAERERKVLQALVDQMFVRFKDIILKGRPKLDQAMLDELATGQIYTSQQALEGGLIDRIGFLEDAVTRAVELAGLTAQTARVIRYSRPRGLLDDILGTDFAASSSLSGFEALAEWTSPKAWYLCSWWPSLITSAN